MERKIKEISKDSDIHRIKSTSEIANLSINKENSSSISDKEKCMMNQIINYLYLEYHSIDLFSTNELERVIVFSGYNKQKTLSLLENHTKEEIMKLIEDFDLRSLKKAKSSDWSSAVNEKLREVYHVGIRNKEENLSLSVSVITPWNFISNAVNLIDLKDLLNSYDHFKLIKKAKSTVKDRDNKKLSEYFEKYYESRERKCRDIFKANLEQNDLNFLKGDEYMQNEVIKNQKKSLMNNLTEKLKNLNDFQKLFLSSNEFVKTHILEYLDIFSIGKFGLVSKFLYNFVYKKFSLEKTAKTYCLAIFKNTNNYINDPKKMKKNYKNYLSMFIQRPRVRYGGIYYAKVRYNKAGEDYGVGDLVIRTVTYYRLYRFLPNGEVYCITTPNVKSNKLVMQMNKSNVDMKCGRYYVEEDDTLVIELNAGIGKSGIYRYKIREMEEYPKLKFNSLELLEYMFKSGSDVTQVKITEFFPKYFKFRSLDVLKNEVYLYKTLE